MSKARLVITIDLTDENDLDWVRNKCVDAVNAQLDEDESRLDGSAEVSWEVEDV